MFLGVFVLGSKAFGDDPQPATPAEAEPEPPNVVRPEAPDTPPNPDELKVRPQQNGMLRFNFHGQPWPGVVEWLADVSNLSLDWQELPSGFVNLRTKREYTVDEARDLINRQLLDRGFTLLKDGEMLSVVSVKKLDPSLVPWVDPDDLAEAQPHDFVRVVFMLDTLSAEAAATEFKSLLSPNGKLSALKSTNRIEALDAVVNLRQIHKLLTEEQSPAGQERQVREFKLKHTRAADVQQQLQKLLGLDKTNASASGQNPDSAALVQQMAQIIQRGAAPPAPGQPARGPSPPPVYIIADSRDNSILAHAPAEQMGVITQAIRMIDTPHEKERSVLRDNVQTQVYPLTIADPDTVMKMLQELGDLDPASRLQVDRKRRAIVAHAALADHLRIRLLIDKVDGKARNFRVLRLRRVQADYVASAIDLVMGGGDGSKRAAGQPPASDDEARRFRVVADVEQNRLLLWVNDPEFEEVQNLLTELGETPNGEDDADVAKRIVDVPAQLDQQELLERLQELWPSKAANPLEIAPRQKPPAARQPKKPAQSGSARRSDKTRASTEAQPQGSDSGSTRPSNSVSSDGEHTAAPSLRGSREPSIIVKPRTLEIIPVSQQVPAREPSGVAPPVIIERGPDGRWTISSEDEEAVELARKLLSEIAPPTGDLKIYRLKHKHVSAFSIAENLKQVFDQKQKADRTVARFFDPSSGKWISNSREVETQKQNKSVPPRFIVDHDTNSIVAIGADAAQRKVIEEVITLYDVPETRDPLPTRTTQLIKIQHAQVRQLAESIKEVYRDLLTVNEPPARPDQRDRPPPERFTYIYGSKNGEGGAPEMQVRYKGQLSISMDEPSNTLLVSAPNALLTDVVRTIEELDEAAAVLDQRVRVVRVNRQINAQDFRKSLQRIGTRPQMNKSHGDSGQAGGR